MSRRSLIAPFLRFIKHSKTITAISLALLLLLQAQAHTLIGSSSAACVLTNQQAQEAKANGTLIILRGSGDNGFTITNNTGCDIPVTLFSAKTVGTVWNQPPFFSQQVNILSGSSQFYPISVPTDCGYQYDVWYGGGDMSAAVAEGRILDGKLVGMPCAARVPFNPSEQGCITSNVCPNGNTRPYYYRAPVSNAFGPLGVFGNLQGMVYARFVMGLQIDQNSVVELRGRNEGNLITDDIMHVTLPGLGTSAEHRYANRSCTAINPTGAWNLSSLYAGRLNGQGNIDFVFDHADICGGNVSYSAYDVVVYDCTPRVQCNPPASSSSSSRTSSSSSAPSSTPSSSSSSSSAPTTTFNNGTCSIVNMLANVQPGQSFNATFQVSNTGTRTWIATSPMAPTGHKLMSNNPNDNTNWGPNRLTLPGNVAPGQTVNVNATLTAPATSGMQTFAFQMGEEGVERFGQVCQGTVTLIGGYSSSSAMSSSSSSTPPSSSSSSSTPPSSSSSSTPPSSSSSSSAPQVGCIDIYKEAFNPSGNGINIVPQFTFQLDNGQTVQNDSSGHARFNNVSAGAHTVSEFQQNGWTQVLVTPSNGVVNVSGGGGLCAGIIFKNQQNSLGGSSSSSIISSSSSSSSSTPPSSSSSSSSSTPPSSSSSSSSSTPLFNGGTCSIVSMPGSVTAGQSFGVTFQVSNTGTKTWIATAFNAPTGHKLMSNNPNDNTNWGPNRIALPGNVTPGQTVNVNATLTAPMATGTQSFFFQMGEEGVERFGQVCQGMLTINSSSSSSSSTPPSSSSSSTPPSSSSSSSSVMTSSSSSSSSTPPSSSSSSSSSTPISSSSSSSSIMSSSSSSSVQQLGCIDIFKTATNSYGQQIWPAPPTTIYLDDGQIATTDGMGRAHFNNVTPGVHTYTQYGPNGQINQTAVVNSNACTVVNVHINANSSNNVVINQTQPTYVAAAIDHDEFDGEPRLSLQKSALSQEVFPGGMVEYSVVLRNTGSGPMRNIRVIDYLPQDVSVIDAGGADSHNNSQIEWRINRLDENESHTIRYRIVLGTQYVSGRTAQNNVRVTADDDIEEHATATVVVIGSLPQTGSLTLQPVFHTPAPAQQSPSSALAFCLSIAGLIAGSGGGLLRKMLVGI